MFPPSNLRDDFGYCVVHHVTQGPSCCSCLHGFLQQEPLPCAKGGGAAESGTLPEFRSIAVQTKPTIQSCVGIIHPLGRVLFDGLRKGV